MLKRLRCDGGNVGAMLALAAAPLLGGIGVAMDMARVTDLRADVSAALDGAVLAAVSESTGGKQISAAKRYFDANFDKSRVNALTVKFQPDGSNTLKGSVNATFDAGLSSVLGFNDVGLEEVAVAEKSSEGSNICVMTLSPNASQSLLVNSGAHVVGKKCEMHVSSKANPAAIFNAQTNIDMSRTCIAGRNIIDNGSNTKNIETECSTAANPFKGTFPVPADLACTSSSGNYSGNTTLNPGVFCGWHNFNSGSNVKLNPGTYIIKDGGWNVNGGDWSGNGVTFYFADTSKVQFNSAVKATLKAPKTGVYAGALFVEKEGLPDSQFVLDDNRGFEMEGAIYLPSREVVFNSGTAVHSQKITAVMRTVIFNGVHWKVEPAGGGGSDQTVRLIE